MMWMARARAREGVCWVSKVQKRDHLLLSHEKNKLTTEGGDEGGARMRTNHGRTEGRGRSHPFAPVCERAALVSKARIACAGFGAVSS